MQMMCGELAFIREEKTEKAFLLHYGTSKIHGSHWVDEADQDAGPMVQDVFEKIWDRHLKGG